MFPENQVRTHKPPTEKGCCICGQRWSKATAAEVRMASSPQGTEGRGMLKDPKVQSKAARAGLRVDVGIPFRFSERAHTHTQSFLTFYSFCLLFQSPSVCQGDTDCELCPRQTPPWPQCTLHTHMRTPVGHAEEGTWIKSAH